MSVRTAATAACLVFVIVCATIALAAHDVYQCRHRPAEELAELVRPLIPGGTVTVDERTNSLVIVGPEKDRRAVLTLLREKDAAARQVRVHVRHADIIDLSRRGVQVEWEYADDLFVVGTAIDHGRRAASATVRSDSRHYSTSRKAEQMLVIAEGSEGYLRSGRTTPVTIWAGAASGYAPVAGDSENELAPGAFSSGARTAIAAGVTEVETGFVVRPRILEGGKIMLTITPRASYLSPEGGQQILTRESSATVIVDKGTEVILAQGRVRGEKMGERKAGGITEETRALEWTMLLEADVVE